MPRICYRNCPNPTAHLIFTTSDWNSAQTVTVMAAEDTDIADDIATLTHTASGGNYAAATATLTVTVRDAATLTLANVSNQVYTVGQMIAVTLPEGDGGFDPLSYTLTRDGNGPSVAPGLTFYEETHTIRGMTTQGFGTGKPADLIYKVLDANGAFVTVKFTMRTVAAPTFGASIIADKDYTVGIGVNTVLPAAGGGVDPRIYALMPVPDTVIPGLTFVAGSHTLTGTPTTSKNAVALTYTVTDANSITTAQTFMVTVHSAPTFAETIQEQMYAIGESVALTLPVASNGAGTLIYTLARTDGGSPPLPDGLTFNPNPAERSIKGMPSAGFAGAMRYTATDTNGTVESLTFTMQVFGIDTATIDDQNYYTQTAVNLTLPEASGGSGTLTYTLTPDASIPGLTFYPDPGIRTLAGTPSSQSEPVTLTYTATDAEGRMDNRTFMVTVSSALTFADAPPDLTQLYTVGQSVAVTLPEGDGGFDPLSYTLTRDGSGPSVAPGLTFYEETHTIRGMTTQGFGSSKPADLFYTVLDANGASAMIAFTMRTAAAPTFGTSIIADKDYTVGIGVNTVLPAAGGGVDPRIYALMPVPDTVIPGLTFVAGSHTLTGTPTTSKNAVALTYTVTDANSVTIAQTFTVTVHSAPTFAETIQEQMYAIGELVALTLPTASGGFSTPIYTLARTDGGSPTLPDGLTFDPNPAERSIKGMPSAGFAGVMRYTATDTNGAVASLTFTMRVFGIDTATIDDQNYYTETAVNLTLPEASGGSGTLTYTLTPDASIPGLTFYPDPGIRTLAGTPSSQSEPVTLTYTATDAEGRMDNRTFMVTVSSALTFADAPPDLTQLYTVGQSVAVTLPVGSGGFGTLSYTLMRDGNGSSVAPGLTFYEETHTIRGMTTQGFGSSKPADLIYTVLDANGASAMIAFTMRTAAAPTFGTSIIADKDYTVGIGVNTVLPAAGGGIKPRIYALMPVPDTVIPGLTFVAGSHTLTGTPTTSKNAVALTYTVTDANSVTTAQTFTVTVHNAPTFTETIQEQMYAIGELVALTLPEASDGAGTLIYTLARTDGGSPMLPDGLNFNPNPAERSIEGMPSVGFAGASMRYTATDTNGADVGLTFTMRVFGIDTATIDDQNYYTQTAVNLMLPGASGGTGTLSYTLTPDASIPAGLNFAPDTRTLAGTPSSQSEPVTLTYTVTDADGSADNRTFMVTVYSAPTFADAPPDLTQLYTVGQSVAVTLPKGGGGSTPLSYTLTRSDGTPVAVSGLNFYAEDRAIRGITEMPFGRADLHYTVLDANGTSAMIDFTMQVVAAPTFGTTTIDEQSYTIDVDINQVLPAVGGGATPLTYALSPIPAGLSFDPATRTLTGIPPAESTPATLTYTVTDANGFTDALTFMVNFNLVALTVTSTDVSEGDGTARFTVELNRDVSSSFSVSATIGGGTAIAGGIDYTAVTSHTLNFTGTANQTHTISVTLIDDVLAEGPETLLLSLGTPQGAGVAVYSDSIGTITIIDNDIATLTISKYRRARRLRHKSRLHVHHHCAFGHGGARRLLGENFNHEWHRHRRAGLRHRNQDPELYRHRGRDHTGDLLHPARPYV